MRCYYAYNFISRWNLCFILWQLNWFRYYANDQPQMSFKSEYDMKVNTCLNYKWITLSWSFLYCFMYYYYFQPRLLWRQFSVLNRRSNNQLFCRERRMNAQYKMKTVTFVMFNVKYCNIKRYLKVFGINANITYC